ncbi:MAG: hypothetical protein WAU54_19875 [Chania sp.]
MITTLFFVLCGFAVLHFIYEKIALPSLRLHFRNELFKIRDCVRKEIITGQLGKDLAAANLIHEGLNNTINRLHMLTLGNKMRAQQRFETDERMRELVLEHSAVLAKMESVTLQKAFDRTVDIMEKVLLCNNGLFMLYSLPLILLAWLCGLLLKTLHQSLSLLKDRLKSTYFEKSILFMNDSFVRRAVYAH